MPHHGTYFNEKFSTSDPGPLGHLAGPRALRKNNYFLEPIREAGSPRLDFGEALSQTVTSFRRLLGAPEWTPTGRNLNGEASPFKFEVGDRLSPI